jgi:hypothetical protein
MVFAISIYKFLPYRQVSKLDDIIESDSFFFTQGMSTSVISLFIVKDWFPGYALLIILLKPIFKKIFRSNTSKEEYYASNKNPQSLVLIWGGFLILFVIKLGIIIARLLYSIQNL